jgi:hypothetical protein
MNDEILIAIIHNTRMIIQLCLCVCVCECVSVCVCVHMQQSEMFQSPRKLCIFFTSYGVTLTWQRQEIISR